MHMRWAASGISNWVENVQSKFGIDYCILTDLGLELKTILPDADMVFVVVGTVRIKKNGFCAFDQSKMPKRIQPIRKTKGWLLTLHKHLGRHLATQVNIPVEQEGVFFSASDDVESSKNELKTGGPSKMRSHSSPSSVLGIIGYSTSMRESVCKVSIEAWNK